MNWSRFWLALETGGVSELGVACSHEHTRNIYGDEITMSMRKKGPLWRRRLVVCRQRCLDCGRALDLPLREES